MDKVQRIVQAITHRKYPIAVNQIYRSNGKLIYCIEVTNQRGVQSLLEALLPYLTVKKAQAEAAIAFCESRKANRHYGSGHTPDELALPVVLKQLKLAVFDYGPRGVQIKRPAPTPLCGQEGEAMIGANRNVG